MPKTAAEAGAEFEAAGGLDEGGEGGDEGGGQEGQAGGGNPPQPEDDDAFSARAEKEGLKAVPYDRFKTVNMTAKELKKWRTEHEPRLKELDGLQGQLKYLGSRLASKPYLQKAVADLLASEDGSLNEQELLTALTEALKGADKGGAQEDGKGGAPKSLDEKSIIDKVLAQVQQQQEVKDIHRSIDDTFAKMPKLMKSDKYKADFEGIVPDELFLDEVEQQLVRDTNAEKATGEDLEADIMAAAKTVAGRHQAIMDRVLKRQVDGAGKKAGAATIPAKGGSGGAKPKVPNRHTDPDGFDRYRAQVAADFEREQAGEDGQ